MSDAGVAPARVALAGNPSDCYGGAVLAVTVPGLRAQAAVQASGGDADANGAPARELVRATIARFARDLAPQAAGAVVTCSTTIPRSVGLGGSSALVIATLRALCGRFGVTLAPLELARLALAVEVEELGIAAGPQDRIAQAFGGLTAMDFAAQRFERLDPRRLPPLLVAWRTAAAADSGPVHDDLGARFRRGEPAVLRSLAQLADAARAAARAVGAGDVEALRRCANRSFDARAAMMPLDPRHVELIGLARRAGAAANYAGSGGAIVCVCRDAGQRRAVGEALADAGCELLAQ